MTGGIADGEEDGLVFLLGFGKGFVTPGVPIYWVVSVLQ